MTAGLALLSACGPEQRHMSSSPMVPAAEGIVHFEKTKNDNVAIDLAVKRLANPEKLTPPASTYVVWVRSDKNAAPQNVGALKVDKDLVGTVDTQTPMHSFELFITAEGSGQVMAPAGQPLLWTTYGP